MNQHRNIAIEVIRGSKWTTIVTGWTPTHREKLLNEEVDREWHEISMRIHAAIERFLKPSIQTEQNIEASAIIELRRLLNGK